MLGNDQFNILTYQGGWDAAANDPDITGETTTGFSWLVTNPGNTDLGGITDWYLGDWAIKIDGGWSKLQGINASVNWGAIGGTLGDQADLQDALNLRVLLSQIDTDPTLSADSDTLIASQKATKAYVDSVVSAAVVLQGDWNADTNTPDISGTTTTGYAWRVSVAGSTNLGGITDWDIGDLAVKTDAGWLKIENSAVSAIWGNIIGNIANQADLVAEFAKKQNIYDDVYNDTGANFVAPLTPVYVVGTENGGIKDVALSDADATSPNFKARRVYGLTTTSIADGAAGQVIRSGDCVDCNTSAWVAGTELWLSETAGTITSTKPLLPSSQIRVGTVIVQSATVGLIAVEIEDLSWVGSAQTSNSAAERTGFVQLSRVAVDSGDNPLVLNTDDVTRTFSITAPSGSFPLYSMDNLFVKASGDSVVWTDVEGDHFFYYDDTGTLRHTETFSDSFILGPDAFVSYLYWDATNKETILDAAITETHGLQMDGSTHLHFHETLGAQVEGSGMSLGDLVVDGNGNTDSHAQFSVESGLITDEDILHAIPAVGSTSGLRILYLEGAAGNLRQIDNAGFPVIQDTAFGAGTGRLAFNEWTGTEWVISAIGNNDFVLCHVFAIGTADGGLKTYAVLGQADYLTAGQARDGAQTELGNLVTQLPFKEIRPLATVIFQTGNAYTNAVQARVRPSDDGDYVDWRFDAIPGGTGFTPSDHNALSGRSTPTAHPALAVNTDTANFDGILGPTDTYVQTALETIDEYTPPAQPDWSETVKGIVEKATTAEAQAGTDTTRGMTPATTKSSVVQFAASGVPSASTTVQGKVERATTTEATTGTDTTRHMTPATTRSAIDNRVPTSSETVQGKIERATQAEAQAGTDNTRAMTPLRVAQAIGTLGGGTVSQVSTRSTSGTWTITGLTVGKPLYFIMTGTAQTNTYFKTNSGTNSNDSIGTIFLIGSSSTKSITLVPTSTTVVVELSATGNLIRAYQ